MAPFEQLAGERLSHSLGWLRVAKLVARLDNGEQAVRDSRKLLPILRTLSSRVSSYYELHFALVALDVLCRQLSHRNNDSELIDVITERMNQVRERLKELTQGLENVDYPFDHAKGRISIAKHLGTCLTQNDLGELMSTAKQAVERFAKLYTVVAARLTQIAEQIERALKLRPLERKPIPAQEKKRNP